MKSQNMKALAFALCAALALAAFGSTASVTSPAPTTVAAAAPIKITAAGQTTVSARGEVSVFVDPDVATVNLGVSTTDKSAATARQKNTKAMTAVVAAVQKAGVAAKDIQTSNVSIYPTYDYQKSSTEVTGYQVSNTVTITVRDLTKIADVVNAALGAGANQINGVSFDLQDKDSVYDKALADATKKASKKAKVMADAAGLAVGDIVSIVESGAEGQPYYGGMGAYVDMANAAPKEAAAANLGDSIQVGQINVYASVTVTYNASK